MSTLVIEGGHRIEGRIDVEGNKNAALPLMAACLLTERVVHAAQHAPHCRRRGDGAAAAGPGRGGRGHRQHDPAHPLRRGHQGRTRQRAGRTPARLGAAAGPAAGAAWPRDRRAAGRRLPGAPDHQDAPGSAVRHGRARRCRLRASPRGAERLEAGVDLPGRGVGHRHRDRDARGRGRQRRVGDSSRRVRAARRGAGRVPARNGRRHQRRGLAHDPGRGRRHAARRREDACTATTSRRAVGP